MSKFVYFKYMLTIVPFVLLICNFETAWSLSDKKLCADPKCQKIISLGTTQITYNPAKKGLISFKINAPVRIMSKSAGSDPNLWGIDVNGRKGFAPMQFIKETKVLISDKDLKYEIPIESTEKENSLNNNVLKASENVILPKTEESLTLPLEELKPNNPQPVNQEVFAKDNVSSETIVEGNEPKVLLDEKMATDKIAEPKGKILSTDSIPIESSRDTNIENQSNESQNKIKEKDVFITNENEIEYDTDYDEEEEEEEDDGENILQDSSNLNKISIEDVNDTQINVVKSPNTLNISETIPIHQINLENSSETHVSENIANQPIIALKEEIQNVENKLDSTNKQNDGYLKENKEIKAINNEYGNQNEHDKSKVKLMNLDTISAKETIPIHQINLENSSETHVSENIANQPIIALKEEIQNVENKLDSTNKQNDGYLKENKEIKAINNEYGNQNEHDKSKVKLMNLDTISAKETVASATNTPSIGMTDTQPKILPSTPSNLNIRSSPKTVPVAELDPVIPNTLSIPNDEPSTDTISSTPSDINTKTTISPTTNTQSTLFNLPSSIPSTNLNNHAEAANKDTKDHSNLEELNIKNENSEITSNTPSLKIDDDKTQTAETVPSTLIGFDSLNPVQSTLDAVTTLAAHEAAFSNVENRNLNEFSTVQQNADSSINDSTLEPLNIKSHTTEVKLSTQSPQTADDITEDLKKTTNQEKVIDSSLTNELESTKVQTNLKVIDNKFKNELFEHSNNNKDEPTLNPVLSNLNVATETPALQISYPNIENPSSIEFNNLNQNFETFTNPPTVEPYNVNTHTTEALLSTQNSQYTIKNKVIDTKDFSSTDEEENLKVINSLEKEANGEKTPSATQSTLDVVTDSPALEMPYSNIEIRISNDFSTENQNSETSTNTPTFNVNTHTTESIQSSQYAQYNTEDFKNALEPETIEVIDNSLRNDLGEHDPNNNMNENHLAPEPAIIDTVTKQTEFDMASHNVDASINSRNDDIKLEDNSLLKSIEKSIFSEESFKDRGLFSTILGTVKSFIQTDRKYTDSHQDNDLNRILFNENNKKNPDNQYCPRSTVKNEFSMDNFAEVFALKVLELSDLVLCLAVTGVTLLCFVFGYYCFCNSSREGSLLAKLNLLERSMLASQKENLILKSDLISTRKKLSSIEDNSFGSNDMVMSLKSELEEGKNEKAKLQEQIVNLEKELENAAEAGLELNKIVSELLNNQSGEDSIISSVEELQKQLNEQQNTIMEINANLAEKSRENSELQLLIAEQKAHFSSKITAIEQDNDELEQEKSTLQARLEEIKSEFEEDITKALEGKNNEIKRLQMEIYDSKVKFEEEYNKLQTSNAKVEALVECLKTMKKGNNNNKTEQLIDVAYVRAELLDMQKKYSSLKENFDIESEAKSIAENQLKVSSTEFEKIKEQFHQSEKDKLEAQTRLEVLASYFKEKEAQLQKELSLKETMWFKQQGEATSTVDRLTAMQEEIQSLKSQNDSLRAEIEAQIAAHKAQIGTLENRAHETWLAARQADRRYEEARAEAASLRRKLSTIAAFPNENTAVDAKINSELKTIPSPVPLEPPGSPLIGRLPPPPPFLPPHFMAPPPAFIGMPPPFMPPGEMRPAPLGRIMSPPPQHRSNRSGRYSADQEAFDPYDDEMDDIENIRRHRRHNDSWNQQPTYSPPRTYRSHSPLESRYDFEDDREFLSNTYDTETDLSPPPSPKRSSSWRSENFDEHLPQSKVVPSDKHDKRKHYSSTKKH